MARQRGADAQLLATRSPVSVKAGPKLGVVLGRLDYLGVEHSVIVACGQLARRFHQGGGGLVVDHPSPCS
jgi:hypothetical protein